MIKVQSEVEPCEVNGTELNGLKSSKQLLFVESHWNYRQLVILRYGEVSITVVASDLLKAINNAGNTK